MEDEITRDEKIDLLSGWIDTLEQDVIDFQEAVDAELEIKRGKDERFNKSMQKVYKRIQKAELRVTNTKKKIQEIKDQILELADEVDKKVTD